MEKFLYERLQNKDPKINVWFAFPAIESFAMASLGFLSIFKQLDLIENIFVESRNRPLCQVPQIGIGNKPIDGGFYLFERDEMDAFLEKEPAAILRTIISRGTIETFFTSVSRSLNSSAPYGFPRQSPAGLRQSV